MTKVFIPSYTDDIHALAVAKCLQDMGHEAILWMGADFPSRMMVEFYTCDGSSRHSFTGPNLDCSDTDFDVVWLRRPTAPVLPNWVHESDKLFVEDECNCYFQSLWYTLAPKAFWVNSIDAMKRGNSKLYQLQQAKQSGLNYPATCISNNPGVIRNFVSNRSNGCIYKPFTQRVWSGEDTSNAIWATPVSVDMMDSDSSLQLTPGIFQERIAKAFELRLVFMGTHCVAVKLDTQVVSGAEEDWRAYSRDLPTETYQLPEDIYLACRKLMKNIGLVFAVIDMIVTPNNDHIFLEINEMGQFLWLEELDPQLHLLDMFVNFLLNKTEEFIYTPSNDIVSFNDYKNGKLDKFYKNLRKMHVKRKFEYLIMES